MTNAKRGRRKSKNERKSRKKSVWRGEQGFLSAARSRWWAHFAHHLWMISKSIYLFQRDRWNPHLPVFFLLSPIIVSIPPSHSIAKGEEEGAGSTKGASERETEDRERGGLHHKECNTATVEHQQGATGRSPSEWVIDFNVNHRSDRPQHNRNAPNSVCVWAYVNTHETCT